jgi:hypothetical protein
LRCWPAPETSTGNELIATSVPSTRYVRLVNANSGWQVSRELIVTIAGWLDKGTGVQGSMCRLSDQLGHPVWGYHDEADYVDRCRAWQSPHCFSRFGMPTCGSCVTFGQLIQHNCTTWTCKKSLGPSLDVICLRGKWPWKESTGQDVFDGSFRSASHFACDLLFLGRRESKARSMVAWTLNV